MEDEYPMTEEHKKGSWLVSGSDGPVPTRSVLGGVVAGSAIGGPLFGMMGFGFLASLTLLLVISPLLLIFSPLLLGAALVFASAVAGLGAAGLTALAGTAALGWVFRELGAHWRLLSGVRGGGGGSRRGAVDAVPVAEEKPKERGGGYRSA